MDKVLEFDQLRTSLQTQCVQQQETIDQLPLLEVTEEQLLREQQECHALLEQLGGQAEAVQKLEGLAEQFLRDTEVRGAGS